MQSGISASQELYEAFNGLVSSSTERGLLVGIEKERLVPVQPIPSTSADFSADLANLAPLLKGNEAAYVILRRWADASDGFVAVTYVPDSANVRQKMLFASTRLTLVRELGTERFRETSFATTREELTAEGFRKHDRHGELKAPLTEGEETLQSVRAAEAEESRGTSAKSSHVSSGVAFPITDEALQALKGLETGSENLVQLRIDVPNEKIELGEMTSSDADGLATRISDDEPRYSFFRYEHDFEGSRESPIIFIYTCPGNSKIKERMVYASSRAGVLALAASEAGLSINKKLEASNPSEITAAMIHEEFHPKQEQKSGFSRPKRPGRR
ncbi:MAG: Twinfilin-1 [Sclerophora amabilis]|nr:MAG: Twinfilin-1 [Sclerophora amabilis]